MRSGIFILTLVLLIGAATDPFGPFTPGFGVYAQGTQRYVAPGGTNAGGCTNPGSPCGSLTYALTASNGCTAGDTINVASGTYTGEPGPNTSTVSDNSVVFCKGTSYTNAVTIQGASPKPVFGNINLNQTGANAPQYQIWRNIIVDGDLAEPGGAHGFRNAGDTHHIRFIDVESQDAVSQGFHVTGTASVAAHHIELLGTCSFTGNTLSCTCRFHDGGSDVDLDHGIYIEGDDNIVSGCESYNNAAHGMQFSGSGIIQERNTAYGNYFHDNGSTGTNGSGFTFFGGNFGLIYNNIITRNKRGLVHSNGTDVQYYNNTVYNSGTGFEVEFGGPTIVVRNNILRSNVSSDWSLNGITITQSDNLCNHADCEVNADPGFVNPTTGDFRLASGTSPAIGQAMDLGSIFTTDFSGHSRPSGAWDMGAFEYESETLPPPDCDSQFNGTIQPIGCDYSGADSALTTTVGPLNTTTCDSNCAFFVFIGYESTASITLVDSTAANSYTCGTVNTDGAAAAVLCYIRNPVTASSQTWTVSSPTDAWPILSILAVEGVASSPFIDQVNSNDAGGVVATLAAGSVSPLQTNELILTGLSGTAIGTNWCRDYTIDNSFVIIGAINCSPTSHGGGLAYFGQSALEIINPTWSWTNADDEVATVIVSVKAASQETPPAAVTKPRVRRK